MSDTPRTKAVIEAIEKDGGNHNIRDYYQSLQVYAEQQERELVAMTKERDDYHRKACDIADQRDELKARVAELERGEFICKKCGIRKNDEHEKGEF